MANIKISEADKAQIVWMRAQGASTVDIAEKLHVTRKTVSTILNDKNAQSKVTEYQAKVTEMVTQSMKEFLDEQQGTVQSLIRQILESASGDIAKARLGEKMKALETLAKVFPVRQDEAADEGREVVFRIVGDERHDE